MPVVPQAIYDASTNLIKVVGLKNQSTGAYVNDATVTAVIKDSSGETITGGESITFAYQSGSSGEYHGTVPYSLDVSPGDKCFAEITIVSGSIHLAGKLALRVKEYPGE